MIQRYGPYRLRINLGEVGLFTPPPGQAFVCKEVIVTNLFNQNQGFSIASTGLTWWTYNCAMQNGYDTKFINMSQVVPVGQTITGLMNYGNDFGISVTFSGILIASPSGRSVGVL